MNGVVAAVSAMTLEDLERVVAIERESHPVPKGRASFEADLAEGWAWVVTDDGEVCGYLVAREAGDDLEVIDVAVAQASRGRRLAGRLMATLHAAAGERRVVLEVRVGNAAARRLYERHGYRQVGVRRGYYADNGEDALVLAYELGLVRAERAGRAQRVRGLYPILSDDVLKIETFGEAAARLADHVSVMQVRLKVSPDDVGLAALRDVARRLAGWPGLLVVNDRADLVRLVDCDVALGLHVGQGDLPLAVAREVVAADVVVGVSTHDAGQLAEALAGGADVVAFGPVFATATKVNPDPVVGLARLAGARAAVEAAAQGIAGGSRRPPLVAIGGLTPERAAQAMAHGADAVAVIGGLFAEGLEGVAGRLAAYRAALGGAGRTTEGEA